MKPLALRVLLPLLLPAGFTLTALALHGADAVSPVARSPVAVSPVLGAISSNRPIVISQTTVSPTMSPSWPIVEGDEIVAREGNAFLVTPEKNRVVLDRGAAVSTRRVESGELYVYLRQGSLTFQVHSRRVYICAANRLYVAKTSAAGVLRMDASGGISDHLNGGQFEERGLRPCNEHGLLSLVANPATGPAASAAGVAAGSAAAAGGVAAGSAAVSGTAAGVAAGTASVGVAAGTATVGVAAGTAAAGAAVSTATVAIATGAAAASASAVGVAASSLASGGTQNSTSSSTATPTTCASGGCNFVPPPVSGSLPL